VNAFVDTSGIYAAMDAADERHAAARRAWVDLLQGGANLHTTNYILIETVALLQSRIGMDSVRAFTTDILPLVNVHWVDEALHLSAYQALLLSGRRRLSLVDCVSFEAMRRLHLTDVFCFDMHFAEQGFRVLPEQKS